VLRLCQRVLARDKIYLLISPVVGASVKPTRMVYDLWQRELPFFCHAAYSRRCPRRYCFL